ncbi:hypothetical protein [Metarhizobium album]|nr:hypothetical protein [Rhizobium album]
MTAPKTTPGKAQAGIPQKTDLASLYRPLGIKAVLAAALMQKPKQKKKFA